MRKILSVFIVIFYILNNILSIATALQTDERASPWTREKATHLAQITLFNANKSTIDALYAAGSASAAVNMIFPDVNGSDRTNFNAAITNYTASGFNWGDANHATRLYQLVYAADPYEGKRKLFSLFEDIFSVNRDTDRDITYKDVYELHTLLFNNMLGNYQTLVKKVLGNNGSPGDYAAGKFLDLYNQKDPTKPNENFARELLQLFLMGEYEPYESKDNNDIRNYEESDVLSLAKILTGLKADAITHVVSFDPTNHYSGAVLKFLSGALTGMNPAYYDSASGTVDPTAILTPTNGNNGLTDNTIEYIFAKRSDQIALFLADRIARFYISDTPSRSDLDFIAQIIKNNNFEILPSIKAILVLDMVYTNASMNIVRYKNPLELTIGTIRFLRDNTLTGIVQDPNVYDTNLLRRLGWTPYFPGSIFGRDGFDNSLKWSSTSNQGAWMSASNYFTYRTSGTGALDFLTMLGNQKKEITTGNISVMTHTNNSYSGTLTVVSGSLNLGNAISGVSVASVSLFSIASSDPQYVYPLDPVVSIYGGENLDLFPNPSDEWKSLDIFLPEPQVNIAEVADMPSIDTTNIQKTEPAISVPEVINTGTISVVTGAVSSGNAVVDTGSVVPPVVNIELTGSTEIPTITVSTKTESTIVPDVQIYGLEIEVNTGEVKGDTSIPEVSLIADPIPESTGSIIDPVSSINTGTTDSGSTPKIEASTIVSENTDIKILATTEMISTGSVTLPIFKIVTALGTITVGSGTYNGDTRTLLIHSGVVVNGGSGTEILSGSTIVFDANSKLIADTIQPIEIVDIYENYIYGEKRLQSDVRVLLTDFLTKDSSGATLPVSPTNTAYFNKYIRGLLSILMSQPEYVLLSGYDLPMSTSSTDQHFLDNISGKIFFVELYGGNDYMTSIIPKDEYSTYLDYRSNQTGSIAITGTGLVDLGDVYMNSALAYGSGGGPGFKSLYDQGYLKIFNRVGGYKHSNDHDAAAKQITSYDSSTSISAEGAFGHLVKSEFESSHTISLGSKLPNIYRAGHFVNLGGNIILSNPLDQSGQYKSHMDTMVKITMSRNFPANTRDLFKDAGRISEIGKTSVAQGGPSGANGDMNSVFRFAKVLMSNNIGRSFYMGGYGGYDTHGDQFKGLNRNLNFVSTAVTNFFNEVKDTQDVTIVIFSEFGRTNKTNGDLGTDHGDGGGMYVVTSNQALRTKLQAGTYGNMSIKNAKYNSLGVGIDYRSVYGSIFNSLYGLDESNYFGTPISLSKDISLAPNTISLLNYSYQASGQTPLLNIELTVSGSNYDPGKSGYTRYSAGTGLTNQRTTRLNDKIIPGGFRYNFQINPNNQPYFTIESLSNQYAITTVVGSLTGTTRPIVLAGSDRQISQIKTSILPMFGNTTVPSVLSGSGLILEATGSNILPIANNPEMRIIFASGVTNVNTLTYALTGSTTWRGGFTLGEKIDKEMFIPQNATITSDNKTIQKQNITHLFKIGADVRGVGMTLNQNVGIEFLGLPVGEKYRAITSQDGVTWSDVELAGNVYTSSATGSILVSTNHFSYFALLANTAVEVPPSCTISINPTSVTNGSGAIISWTMLNSLTGTLNPGNVLLGLSGSISIVPPSNATTPYTLVVSNSAGTSSCTATVTAAPVVVVVPPIVPPSCTISINPTSITNGSGAVLSWNMTGSLTGTLNPGNVLLGSSGSISIVPPSNAITPYTLVVSNSAGSSSCSASVTAAPVVVVVPPVVVPPVVTPPSSGGGGSSSITGPGGGGGGSSPIIRTIDTCLGGDTSGNNYDGICVPAVVAPVHNTLPVIAPTQSIRTLRVSGAINTLITDLESQPGDIMTNTQEQQVLALTLQTMREITRRNDIDTNSANRILATLQSLKNTTTKTRTHLAIDKLSGVIVQYMAVGGFDNPVTSVNIPVVQPVREYTIPVDPVDSEEETYVMSSTYKYVNAERSVTFRSTAGVSMANILGYFTRNTPVTVIADSINGWTRVIADGVEGYIKSAFLRDANQGDILRSGAPTLTDLQRGYINVDQSGYVRSAPSLTARISAVVYRDSVVGILDTFTGWYEVLLQNGSRGFIRRELVNTMDTTL